MPISIMKGWIHLSTRTRWVQGTQAGPSCAHAAQTITISDDEEAAEKQASPLSDRPRKIAGSSHQGASSGSHPSRVHHQAHPLHSMRTELSRSNPHYQGTSDGMSRTLQLSSSDEDEQ